MPYIIIKMSISRWIQTPIRSKEDDFGGDISEADSVERRSGDKRTFGDLDEEENDMFGSKKGKTLHLVLMVGNCLCGNYTREMIAVAGSFLRNYHFITRTYLIFNGGAYLISGSVDNNCIIWDVSKGSIHQILDAHLHYVQGVAWDPLGQYVASLSSDRTCRIYVNKPQSKNKCHEKINYVCQHVLTKFEPQKLDDSKQSLTKTHLFHDETLPSFFRRLQWSPDGSFLLALTGYSRTPTKTIEKMTSPDLFPHIMMQV